MSKKIDPKFLKFRHPFPAIVSGATGTGKSVLVRYILNNWKNLIHGLNKPKIKVLWLYGINQPLYSIPLKNDVEIEYHSGLMNESELLAHNPDLVVVDDLMTEGSNNKDFSNLFTRVSHHQNISVIFIIQNLYHQAPQMRNISLNCHYYILMQNVRDRAQIYSLARQLYPTKSKSFIEAYLKATSEPYGYLIIDLKPDTPENLRLRSKIFPHQAPQYITSKFAPTVYSLK